MKMPIPQELGNKLRNMIKIYIAHKDTIYMRKNVLLSLVEGSQASHIGVWFHLKRLLKKKFLYTWIIKNDATKRPNTNWENI